MQLFEVFTEILKDYECRSLMQTTAVVLVIGTITYHYLEGWSWIDAFYFSFVTLTTVGYGDITPATDIGKLFTVFYIIIGLGIILGFIDAVYNHYCTVVKNKV